MPITVTTPTGHIGSRVTDILLSNGVKGSIIARDPGKVVDFEKRGAMVIPGSHADVDTVISATKGSQALFLVTPPELSTNDQRTQARSFGIAAAPAVRENKIPHVVHLSSIGAEAIRFDEVAKILSKTLERPIVHETITAAQSKTALVNMGTSPHMAGLLNELSEGINAGKVRFRTPRNSETATPTSYAVFAEEVFRPAFDLS
jgi:hypothetical protein